MYAKGAWVGWKDFEVTKHVDESGTIASFSLIPKDKSMLPLKPYKPGQFVTLRVWVDELGCFQNRHYSLSDSPSPDHYRITVKREDAAGVNPEGLLSTRLHGLPVGSTVQASFPTGSFVLPEPVPENLVLLSAGVGITPNLAILNTVAAKDPATGPNVSWIQGTRTAAEHVFKNHVADFVARSNGKITSNTFYSRETPAEGAEGLHAGHIKVAELDPSLLALQDPKTHYYVCGPDSFMKDVRKGLEDLGVDDKRIVFEAFHAGEV